MPTKSKRPKLVVSEEDRRSLEQLARSRSAAAREVQRAQILLGFIDGDEIAAIAKSVGTTRMTVYKCIDKALAMGAKAGLSDTYHRPHPPTITPEAAAWCVSVACLKPKDLGYAAEVWSRRALADHVRSHAVEAGHPSLSRAAKATVHRILASQPLHPERVRYYLEKRDPEFDMKMRQVLAVYQEVFMSSESSSSGGRPIVTVSVDEKPGVQAIGNTAPDRMPVPGHHPTLARDHEYQRFGTLSILACLDLHDGHVIVRVEPHHRSREFIALLNDLDCYYPSDCTIRVILDNHSAHTSKETRDYLATRPNRFVYVHTPKHGSWLNLVETLFGKMARTFLRHIRVASIEELADRIRRGVEEINAHPVVCRWKYFPETVDAST